MRKINCVRCDIVVEVDPRHRTKYCDRCCGIVNKERARIYNRNTRAKNSALKQSLRIPLCPICQKRNYMEIKGHGMCYICYEKEENKKDSRCPDCGKRKKLTYKKCYQCRKNAMTVTK